MQQAKWQGEMHPSKDIAKWNYATCCFLIDSDLYGLLD
jgi:hypothetical protein